jgi:putative tricarboxylic transport membrane protein
MTYAAKALYSTSPAIPGKVVEVRARGSDVKRSVRLVKVLLLVPLVLSSTACGVTRGEDTRDLLMIIPNSPGGGYDQTGRAAVGAMEKNDITGGSFTVDNVIGAGGAAAMTQLVGEAGDEHTMMTVGLGVVGSTYSFGSSYALLDATPLAQLMSEPEGILVPADSPYKTVNDFVEAWKADPKSLAIGGGSSPGGPDHLFPMQLAAEVGIDPTDVNYVSYDGGGPLTSALLGAKIDAGFSGPAEFVGQVEEGDLRMLAVSGEKRSPQDALADVPTLTESGVDLVFLNWRGVLAPPDISDERRAQLIGYLKEMHRTEAWKKQLSTNGWTDDFKTGDDFTAFIKAQDERVSGTLNELGLI